jgi:hypothetical protein
LEGETFWLFSQRGRRADYVRNLESQPRVRVRRGMRTRWLAGTAHIVDDDDPMQRRALLLRGSVARSLCVRAASATVPDPTMAPVTVRIDLDPR